MTLFLTGSPCNKGIGHFTSDGGFLQRLKERLPKHPAILLVSAAPDDPDNCRWVFDSTKECLVNSGIEFSSVRMLARDNAAQAASLVADSDFVILCGGHVPTQNRFFREIGLRDILKAYDGVILACSAGSMNCAEEVYSHPELPGEGSDPFYQSRFEGLGLTDINIVPHLEDISDAWLDGRRLLHDIILPMSYGHRFYPFCDGVYVIEENGRRTLYGEAWVIENGDIRKISEREGPYSFMNLVFISPHFPATYSHFCAGLRANGVNVLGIADAPYESLSNELKESLTEYYRVDNMEDYEQMFKAVAFLSYKYGKIDWIESNNEYWLEQDAKLREDGSGWNIYKNGGRVDMGIDAVEWAMQVEKLGAGEILLTSMDGDGTKAGYDLPLTKAVADAVNIPVIASGGAGKMEDFYDGIVDGKADAVLAASLFHFGEIKISDLKEYLKGEGIPVRQLAPSLEKWQQFKKNKDDMVPAITIDANNGEVLMMAYMNYDAFDLTCKTGYMHYYSRSRDCLWKKGETSGHLQKVVEGRIDCDMDTLLYKVEQTGAACHTGNRSCFYRTIDEI